MSAEATQSCVYVCVGGGRVCTFIHPISQLICPPWEGKLSPADCKYLTAVSMPTALIQQSIWHMKGMGKYLLITSLKGTWQPLEFSLHLSLKR